MVRENLEASANEELVDFVGPLGEEIDGHDNDERKVGDISILTLKRDVG